MNGDIIDFWQFNKRHWDVNHTKIVRELLKLISKGVQIHYIAGNHDEALRRFLNFKFNGFKISNKLKINLDGKKAWFFHGDVFDVTMKYSRWITILGSIGYDFLIALNYLVNRVLKIFGQDNLSFSKRIKNRVKAAVSYINDFETTVAEIAIKNGFDYVICGHIHRPSIREIKTNKGKTTYLNSGDWIENLTALEYNNKNWTVFQYDNKLFKKEKKGESDYKNSKQLFNEMVADFELEKSK